MAAIDALLKQMLEKGGSDLHLTVGLPPKTRASGTLKAMSDKLFGSTVDHVDLGRFALNDRFQMAFSYTLMDGRSGIAIASFNGEKEGDELFF